MEKNIKKLTRAELSRLSTKRLLSYYNVMRAKTHAFEHLNFYTQVGDYDTEEEFKSAEANRVYEVIISKIYLNRIKNLLDTRENVLK